jgi:hypothetical protein
MGLGDVLKGDMYERFGKQIQKYLCIWNISLDHLDDDSNPSKSLDPMIQSLSLAQYVVWPTKSFPFRAFPCHCRSYIS